ncbi:MAG: lipopolysaccharide biosynthesis protein [Gammaproteobacteria bacterium]
MSETADLDRALVSGIAWTAVMRWSSQLISWVATFYVARILVPGDYGIASMAMVAIGLARMIEDFGLDAVLVQDRSIEGAQQARLAGMLVLLGVFLTLLYLALAYPIAGFFGEPNVAWAIMGLSFLFITDALQIVPRAILQRQLAFGKLALLAFLQVVVTQSALIAAATAGWGFKSLVVNSLAGAVFSAGLLYYWSPYAIHWPRDIAGLAKPLLQGWRMLASSIGYYAYSNADQAIIGRFLGKDALGAYSFATGLSTTAMREVGAVVTKVVPGIFSASQHRRHDLRRYFLVLTELVALVTLPMSIGLALTADLIVPVALGPQWQAVIAPLRILCIYTAFFNAQLLTSHLLTWTGQFRAQMWCTMVTAAVLPLAFLAAVRFDLEAVALVWALVYPLTNIPALIISLRTISLTFGQWFAALWPAVCGCLVMSAAVLAIGQLLPHSSSDLVRLGSMVLAGGMVYALTLLLFFRARVLAILSIVRVARSGLPARAEPAALLP